MVLDVIGTVAEGPKKAYPTRKMGRNMLQTHASVLRGSYTLPVSPALQALVLITKPTGVSPASILHCIKLVRGSNAIHTMVMHAVY